MKGYCEYLDKTPTKLIEEAELEEDQQVRMKNRKIKRYILKYINYLKDECNTPATIPNKIGLAKTFYSEFDIEIPRIRLEHPQQQHLTTDDIPSMKHIRQVLLHSNFKYQAITLLMLSSGMGSGETRSLKIKDFLDATGIILNDLSNIEKIKEWKKKEYQFPYGTEILKARW